MAKGMIKRLPLPVKEGRRILEDTISQAVAREIDCMKFPGREPEREDGLANARNPEGMGGGEGGQ